MVIGECCLNDAVAIALSYSVENFSDNYHEGDQISIGAETLNAVLSFLSLFIFSLLIGFVVGVFFSWVFKVLDMHRIPWIEIGIFILASYFPYILAEGFECSGLLAILMCAIIMRNYCFNSLSPVGSISLEFLIEMSCNVSECFVFCYMGISIPMVILDVKISLIVVGVIALLISRFGSIYLTMVLITLFKKKPIPFSYSVIMTWGGLRGAIAFYLALQINSEFKNLIITTTISLIVFTIVCLGATMQPILFLMVRMFPQD